MNTLTFTVGATSVSLRRFYNLAESVIRNDMLRLHPSSAAHATQSWRAYETLIDLVFAMSPGGRLALAEWVWQQVLSLAEHPIAAVKERVVRPFEYVLTNMSTAARPGGAIFQAFAYGYLRADSPNLILESYSVNTGSSRKKMLGDVVGYRGQEPELAAEVKDLELTDENVDDQLGNFFEDIAGAPNATAVVICRAITSEARGRVEARGVTVLDKDTLRHTVAVWDLPKQQEALRGVEYFLARLQRNVELVRRFRVFCAANALDAGLGRADEPDVGGADPTRSR